LIVRRNRRKVRCYKCTRVLERGEFRVVEHTDRMCPECYLKTNFSDLYSDGRSTGKDHVIDIITVFLPLLLGKEVAEPIILALNLDDSN